MPIILTILVCNPSDSEIIINPLESHTSFIIVKIIDAVTVKNGSIFTCLIDKLVTINMGMDHPSILLPHEHGLVVRHGIDAHHVSRIDGVELDRQSRAQIHAKEEVLREKGVIPQELLVEQPEGAWAGLRFEKTDDPFTVVIRHDSPGMGIQAVWTTAPGLAE